jgi:hypothetical protein
MRAISIAALTAALMATLLAGCMSREPRKDRSGEVGYNRRELTHPQPGILTGDDGVWTVYRNDADRSPDAREPAPPPPKKREILMCDVTTGCEPEDASE